MTNWSSYAEVYDLMADNNPAYQELVSLVLTAVESLQTETTFRAAEIGAGTGNFSLAIAEAYPQASVIHLDADAMMIQRATEKATRRAITNITFRTEPASPSSFAPDSLDLCITVHALYAIPNPDIVLRAIHAWLRPGGIFIAINLGRELKIADWTRYMFRIALGKLGPIGTLRLFVQGRDVARQNRRIAQRQACGVYWTHSHAQFVSALRSAGFDIVSAKECYRGYSDFAACRKKPQGITTNCDLGIRVGHMAGSHVTLDTSTRPLPKDTARDQA